MNILCERSLHDIIIDNGKAMFHWDAQEPSNVCVC